ncbi:acetyl-CoA C-acetyltransferase [Hyphomicrobium sp.]|uniref:acetyl-CoA C-acetyltransferase n=1 Tax=Hyphomicrobium sp. TaxID=82 RepID=UPI003F72548E
MAGTLRRIGIVGGVRTPFCRSNTLYADLSNLDLMTAALNGLVDKYRLKGVHIDEVVGGAVVTHSKDFNLAREAVLGTKLAPSTPGITLQQACGTSLQAAAMIGAKIASGEIECGIAVGSDTTSDAPIVFSKKFSARMIQVGQQKTLMDRIRVFKGFSPSELAPQPPNVAEPRTGLTMGQHCELMAREWKIGRQEQDRFAFESHRKGADAYRSGYMDDLIVPTAGVFRDNNLREDMSLDKLATLKTAFDKSDKGTLTAANSTPMTDGAACVLLCSEEWAAKHGLALQSYLTYSQSSANNFTEGEGLLMAPTIAVSRMLERAHLSLQDFDYYEIHEAFAAQVLATLKAWEDPIYCKTHFGKDMPLGSIDRTKLNVKGSSLAFGHPFAATGARVLANLSKLLSEHGGRGLISVCTAGGMGVAAILESANRAEARVAA